MAAKAVLTGFIEEKGYFGQKMRRCARGTKTALSEVFGREGVLCALLVYYRKLCHSVISRKELAAGPTLFYRIRIGVFDRGYKI